MSDSDSSIPEFDHNDEHTTLKNGHQRQRTAGDFEETIGFDEMDSLTDDSNNEIKYNQVIDLSKTKVLLEDTEEKLSLPSSSKKRFDMPELN